jgi:DNA primase
MGRITDEDIQRVRDATDLADLVSETVVLKRKGRLLWGRCPFHGEKTPSFKIDPATQLWHCFGCGLGGDAFGFMMRTENLDFPDAVRALASRAHIEIVEQEGGAPAGSRDRLYAACNAAAEFYHRVLLSGDDAGAKRAREYLGGRGFGTEVAKRFEIGYAPGRGALVAALREQGLRDSDVIDANLALRADNGTLRDRFYERVMFPIRDVQGRCVGFGGRIVGAGEPKYLNTQETPVFHKSRNLYGIDRARNEIVQARTAIVVEGYTDVIALHEAGVRNVVATLGTALTREHTKMLGRFAKRVVYLFDGDEAGLRAADRAAEFIGFDVTPEAGSERVELDVALIPDGRDPAEYAAGSGAESVAILVESATPLLQFALDRRLAAYDITRPEGRSKALADAASVLAALKGSLLVHDYTNYLADRLLVDYATVQQAVAVAKPAIGRAADEEVRGATEATVALTVSTPQLRAEREALAMLAANPRLRDGARFLLSENLLSQPLHVEILQLLLEHQTCESDELVAITQQSRPELAAAVAGLAVEGVSDADAGAVVSELFRKLEEFALDHQILQKKTRLKSLDPSTAPEEYDGLFRDVSNLQRRRDVLRSRRDQPSDTDQ